MAKQTEHYNFTVPDITDAADITQIDNVINQIDEAMHNIDVEVTAKAPQNHASTENIYGTGTGVDYGHVMLSDSISSVSNDTNGIAATPAAVKAAYDKAVEVGNTLKTDLNSEITNRTTADQDIINLLSGKWDNEIQVEWEYKGAGNRVFGSGDTYDFECITPFRIFIPSSSNSAEKTLFTLGNGDLQIEYGGSIAYLSIQGNEADGISYSSVKTEHAHLGNLDILIKLGDMNLQNDSSGDGSGLYSTATLKCAATNLKGLISDYKGYLPTKAQIGLGNVDNTSDADKPVSAAQQAALNLKSNKWIATTAGDGSAYTVTLDPAPTALEVGMIITIIPHTKSTTTSATLDVNGLGAKEFRQRGCVTLFLYPPKDASFLIANKPVTLMYDGSFWVDMTYSRTSWGDILSKPSSFTPSSHASESTTYGVGTGTNYGHLKLSSATDSTADVDGGTAATPAAAKAAYDKAVEVGNTRIWNSSGVTAANTNSWALSSCKLTMSGARNIALAYGYSYDTLVEMLGEGNLLAACGGVAEFNGGTSAIIGGYAHKLNGIRAVILGGYNNIAHAYNAVCGKSCKEPTATDYNSNSGDLFVVGNGTASTRSNGFRVAANGNCYAGVAFNGTGADYNEVREWSDGNVDDDDRCGYMVAFDGIKIRLAQPGDNLRKVGIISGNSCITGNNFADYWHGKYKRDIYGRYETEPVHNDAEYDEDGNLIKEEYNGYSYVLSDDYDPSLEDEYIPRLDRSEYDLMATHGEVVVRDDGTCEADGYCIPGQDGIATKDNEEIGFYVMERVDENHVRVFVR